MPQSYTRIFLHTIFGTKHRRPLIHPKAERFLYGCIRQRLAEYDCTLAAIGGTLDHIHLIHSLPRQLSIAEVAQNIKGQSSYALRRADLGCEDFRWQGGYASFSVDARNMDEQVNYVRRQKQHHYGDDYGRIVRLTFEQEYQDLLDEYGCEWHPDYLFPVAPAPRRPHPSMQLQ
jgi:REP element-mobilizing transposase RayT